MEKKTNAEYKDEVSKVVQIGLYQTLSDGLKAGIPLSAIADGMRAGVDHFLQAMIDTTKEIIAKYEAATKEEET